MEGLLNVLFIEESVINYSPHVLHPHHNPVITVSISITGGVISLRASFIPEPAPWSIEGCEVPVLLPDSYTMIAIPAINHGFLLIVRHCVGLLQGWLCWVALAYTGSIQWLKIYCTSGVTVVFSTDNHSMTPGHPCVLRHLFQHSQSNIPVNVSFHLVRPVCWNFSWSVDCKRYSSLFHFELQRWAVHEGEGLVFACVESATLETGDEEFF